MIRTYKNFSVLFAFILSLNSCSNPKDVLVADLLVKIDSMVVIKPIEMIQPDLWHQRNIEGEDYLIKGENINGELRIYPLNISNMAYQKTIRIAKDGPNGFNSFKARFYVHNFDSILVFPNTAARILIYDITGELQSEIKYGNYGNESLEDLYGNCQISLTEDGVYFNSISYSNPKERDFFEKLEPVLYFDFKREKLQKLTKFPDKVFDKFLPLSFIGSKSLLCFDTLLVTSFAFDENIYVRSMNMGKEQIIDASIPLKHIPQFDRPYDQSSAILSSLSYPLYEGVYFDNNRERIFRLVRYLKKPDLANSAELLERVSYGEIDFLGNALIEIDENLKVLRVLEVPMRKYFIFTDKGLMTEESSANETEGQEEYVFYSLDEN